MGSRGVKPGSTLYSVWRNSDDKLLILDGTADECGAKLGINRNSFYRLVCSVNKGYGSMYTIRKIRREEAEREAGS